VLLHYMERVNGDAGCPITWISYHPDVDSMLVGDAGCTLALLRNLNDQISPWLSARPPGAHVNVQDSGRLKETRAAGAGNNSALARTSADVGFAATSENALAQANDSGMGSESDNGVMLRSLVTEAGFNSPLKEKREEEEVEEEEQEEEEEEEGEEEEGEEEEDQDEEEEGENSQEEQVAEVHSPAYVADDTDSQTANFPVFQGW